MIDACLSVPTGVNILMSLRKGNFKSPNFLTTQLKI